MKTEAANSLRRAGGEDERGGCAARQRHRSYLVDADGIEHGERVRGELPVGVGGRVGRSEAPLPRPSKVITV
jgi:hypothetical protein